MKIKICFPYYKECPIYDVLLDQAKQYKGRHTFIFKKARGTIVHDVRNILVAETLRIGKDFKLPEFDVVVMIDSDIICSIQDVVYIAEKAFSENCIFGLPYLLRGSESKYNAGFIGNYDFEHLRIQTKGILEVDGQGNGCKAIPRKVFEGIKPFWFWPELITFKDGSIDSLVEDWAFDRKSQRAGFKSICDFNKPVKHNTNQKGANMEKSTTEPKNQLSISDVLRKSTLACTKANTALQEMSAIISLLTEVIDQQGATIAQFKETVEGNAKAGCEVSKV